MRRPTTPAVDEDRALVGNSAAMIVGRILGAGLGWAGTVVIARTLTPDDWGRYSFVFGLLGLMSIVTDLGVGRVVLARLGSEDPSEVRRIAGSFLVLRAVLGVAGYAVAIGYALLTGLSPLLVAAVGIAGTGILLATPSNAMLVLYQSRLRLVRLAIWDVAAQAAQFVLILGVAVVHPTLIAFVLPSLAREALVFLARGTGIRRGDIGIRPDLSARTAFWGEMLREAIPLSIGYALVTLLTKVDILLLQLLDSYESVGKYAVGYKFSDLLLLAVTTVALPFATVLVRALPDDVDAFRTRARQAILTAAAMGFGAVALFWPTAEFLISVLYGREFLEAATAARLLVAASAISGVVNILITILVAARRLALFPWIAGFGVVLNLVLNTVFIPRWSYHGAAIATIVTEGCMFLGTLWLTFRSIPILAPPRIPTRPPPRPDHRPTGPTRTHHEPR